jgi:HD-GYP domain-containing protein (c-di-GMP phosphodiesterase class II)/CheY-like chemotaxis protein
MTTHQGRLPNPRQPISAPGQSAEAEVRLLDPRVAARQDLLHVSGGPLPRSNDRLVERVSVSHTLDGLAGATLRQREAEDLRGAPSSRLRVLVLTEEAGLERTLSTVLGSSGCSTHLAWTQRQALTALVEGWFDLILADPRLADREGADFFSAVRARQPGVPVILLTAPGGDALVPQAASGVLARPIAATDVRTLIDRTAELRPFRTAWRSATVRGLCAIAQLVFAGLDTQAFLDHVLDRAWAGFTPDAVAIVFPDGAGGLRRHERGPRGAITQVLETFRAAPADLTARARQQAIQMTAGYPPWTTLIATFPVRSGEEGMVCLGWSRDSRGPAGDAPSLLCSYARAVALGLANDRTGAPSESDTPATVAALLRLLGYVDAELRGHSVRVGQYADQIALALGMLPEEVAVTRRAAVLHDLGKVLIGDAILQKPDTLTSEESRVMSCHVLLGSRLLRPFPCLEREAEAIRCHHESYDGLGYPAGLRGAGIPLPARVVAVADALDAMTSVRPYRAAQPLEVGLDRILGAGGGQFDPAVTQALASVPLARLVAIQRSATRAEGPGPSRAGSAGTATEAVYLGGLAA